MLDLFLPCSIFLISKLFFISVSLCFFFLLCQYKKLWEQRKVYFEKIAGFFRHLLWWCAGCALTHSLTHASVFFVVFMKKKILYFPFRHKFPTIHCVPGSNLIFPPIIIFTMKINRARCVVRTVQNNNRSCSHFRILRNWDEKTRI